jgi:hypothetical protein
VLFLSKPGRRKEHSMLDELLEVFDRDRKTNPNAPKQKGIRGLLSRLRDNDGDRRYASPDRREYRDNDDDRDYDARRGRRREREGLDFFDD